MPQKLMDEELKFKIMSRLLHNESITDIHKDFADDISYATIVRYKSEINKARENNTLHELLDLDKAVLGDIFNQVQEKKPDGILGETSAIVSKVESGLQILTSLQEELASSAVAVARRIKAVSTISQNMVELDIAADALSKLQSAFFNKNLTQVNIQNNVDSSNQPKYGNWLDDKPTQN